MNGVQGRMAAVEEAHYDTPWEFLHRTSSFPSRERPHSDSSELLVPKGIERGLRCGPPDEPSSVPSSSCQSQNVQHSNVAVRQRVIPVQISETDSRRASSTELERGRFKFSISKLRERANGRDSRRVRYREDEIIHKGIDREIAERQLSAYDTGAFLIRVRDNGTLALSIRASKGVLHIKLELRNNCWVLGEGPSFGSIASIINFYRFHELPIRGAERMLLSKPVLVSSAQPQHTTQPYR
ncbi:unnamed protein product [Gongylonema pulchrum]|uniref:SH2 domain-containing protein n=1 Tax=Gongylonema pulchrum TaxID=637853 RepID=A0A183CWT6_9BILA|nr:unnamed protein product [Gongylonema pulchrum]